MEFKSHPTIWEALLYMIEKAPFNLPSWTTVSLLRHYHAGP